MENWAGIARLVKRRLYDRPGTGVVLFGLVLCWHLLGCGRAQAGDLDLKSAVIVTPPDLTRQESKAITLLIEEVEKRTLVRWQETHSWPAESVPVIAIGPRRSAGTLFGAYPRFAAAGSDSSRAEGYRIEVDRTGRSAPAVLVQGNDPRGVLFGIGQLLRSMRLARGRVTLPDDFRVATAPRFALRGHQLGFRPKTNSYDAWDLPQWEQYFRDLAVFGTNSIELIPPRSDDDADSPHFPRPPMDMMVGMSRLCDDYGLDVWIWYPAMDRDYSSPATVEFALKEWGEVYRKLPRIDAIFVPGGDPGHTQPKHLMALLEKQTALLHRFHPKAQMWVSPQSFNAEWLQEFLDILQKERPSWLSGVVFGPQVRVSLTQLRALVPRQYPIRRYPDITHSLRAEYPVPDWDLAFALTEGRETINPRPLDEATIFRAYLKESVGFISYSEGCNDDVNKIVWSSLGWDPDARVIDILREYSGYFLSDRLRDDFALGLLALESNWRGPLLTNGSVDTTFQQFRSMEKSATPRDLLNWRFQQGLYRAYFDAYTRLRLIHETHLEAHAMDKLRLAPVAGSLRAMQEAEAILDRVDSDKVAPDLRARIHELAEALYQSIRMQLSVERYKAIAVERGANLDTLDLPLNDRRWLKHQFQEIRQVPVEFDRQRALEALLNWTNPGPGGFYDELGNPSRRPHLLSTGPGYAKDPSYYDSPLTGFAYAPERRMSWCRHIDALYDSSFQMRYTDLDPRAEYKLRIVYAGNEFRPGIRLVANAGVEIHPYRKKDTPIRPVEFDIPGSATRDGTLLLTWNVEPGRGGAGRGCQVSEVWLIKKP